MITLIKKLFGAAKSTVEAVVKPEVAKAETQAPKARKKRAAKKKS